MPTKNEELAAKLRLIANLLDYQGERFKPAAYRRGAQTIEGLDRDITTFTTVTELKKLPGIGDAIANKALEFIATGEIAFLKKLQAEIGGSVSELMAIEDLGPKRVAALEQALGIRTVADLISAAKQGKLRTLPRFSELLEKKILANAGVAGIRNKRYPIDDVRRDATTLVTRIAKIPGVLRAEAAGSFRRNKATIGDLDILTAVRSRGGKIPAATVAAVEGAVRKIPVVAKVVAEGSTKMSFDLKSGLRVDVRFVKDSEWGSALLYFTGDKEHNIALRKRAIARGWKLSEYGLFRNDDILASKTEADIYKKLDLPLIAPNERSGTLPL